MTKGDYGPSGAATGRECSLREKDSYLRVLTRDVNRLFASTVPCSCAIASDISKKRSKSLFRETLGTTIVPFSFNRMSSSSGGFDGTKNIQWHPQYTKSKAGCPNNVNENGVRTMPSQIEPSSSSMITLHTIG